MSLSRIAYVCSSGRSGSTLLDLLLGSHPDLVSLGEIEHLPKNIALNTVCSCGASVLSCPFWTKVLDAIKARHGTDIIADPYAFQLGLFRAARVIDHSRQTPAYLLQRKILMGAKFIEQAWGLRTLPPVVMRRYEACVENSLSLYDAVAEVAGCSGVVDSSKEHRRAVSLYQRDPQRVRVILLIRDGRAVFNAVRGKGASRGKSLRFWRNYYEDALRILDRNVAPEHVYRLKYEDLAGNTEHTVHSLCGFLGIVPDVRMLEFRQRTKHVLNGNDMRSATSSEIRLDERWKRELAAEDLAYFVEHGGQAMNCRLGYA